VIQGDCVVTAETEQQRSRREDLRRLFDGVAPLYDATRPGYPAEIVDAVCASAGIGRGADVLEIGCGTGQLTRQLAGRAFNLTAIDIGAAMIRAARRNVVDPMAGFQVCSFEDFAGTEYFDLIVSATAFHWVDPGIGLAKAARLLRPGGWLALLTTEERYPEPLRTRLRELWMRYSRRIVRSASQPAWVAALQETALFGETVELTHTRALTVPVQTVLGVERTRATFLSYSEQDKAGFTADLSALLEPGSRVDLSQETFLAMAPVAM
jgi:ubiquinone/menaquinone biosynthesis C-methylase UbiE